MVDNRTVIARNFEHVQLLCDVSRYAVGSEAAPKTRFGQSSSVNRQSGREASRVVGKRLEDACTTSNEASLEDTDLQTCSHFCTPSNRDGHVLFPANIISKNCFWMGPLMELSICLQE